VISVGRIIFENANLLDGEHAAKPKSTVVVEGDRIVHAGAAAIEHRPGDRIIDCAGQTLMPGMTTGHFHPTYSAIDTTPMPGLEEAPIYLAYKAAENCGKVLRAGFTSAVGASSPYAVDPSLSKAIADGVVVGPRLVPCSAELVTTADSTDLVPWHWQAGSTPGVHIVDGPEEFRKAARVEMKRGAEIIKTYATGGHGVRFGSEYSSATSDELRAIVEAAHSLGKRVRCHVASKEGILKCLDVGIDVIDHGDGIDDECIERMAESKVVYVPSIYLMAEGSRLAGDVDMLGDYGQIVRATSAFLPKCVEAGIPIAMGDDYGASFSPHGTQGKELAFYQKITGLDALEIIKWATVHGGTLVGRPDVGRIAEGYLADIVVLDPDPSADLEVLGDIKNIAAVMRDGTFFHDELAGRSTVAVA
jgi:imidazolonepropionase-like amidohydrolase